MPQPGKPVIGPVIEEVSTTRPLPALSKCGIDAFTQRNAERRLVASTLSHSAGSMSMILVCGKIPALAHITSIPRCACAVLSTMRLTDSQPDTSQTS